MANRCVQCRELLADDAAFCINCGALLRPPAASTRRLIPATGGTTTRLRPITPILGAPPAVPPFDRPAQAGALALITLCYATIEVVGVAQLIAKHGWIGLALWPAVLLAGGALVAENDWINGHLRRGMYGMLCWGALPWLLSARQDLVWLMLPALAWWVIWFCDRRA
jgi:hypothetical protein